MFRILAVGGTADRPTTTRALLNPCPDYDITIAASAAEAVTVLEDQEIDVAVLDLPRDKDTADAVAALIAQRPLLPVVTVTDAEVGPASLFDRGAQDHLCRSELARGTLVRSLHHAVARRAAAARAEAAARKRPATEQGGGARLPIPEILLASTPEEPSAGLLSTLAAHLESKSLTAISLHDLRSELNLGPEQLKRAKRPLGNVLLYLIKRDLDAESELIGTCFATASETTEDLDAAILLTVKTLANFWRQSPASVRLASDLTGLDGRLRDLRGEHLQGVSDRAVDFLADHAGEVAHPDTRRSLEIAVDQLLATLDHQRMLGPVHPSDATPDQVIEEFAERMTFFLRGPEPVEVPAAVTRPTPAATARPVAPSPVAELVAAAAADAAAAATTEPTPTRPARPVAPRSTASPAPAAAATPPGTEATTEPPAARAPVRHAKVAPTPRSQEPAAQPTPETTSKPTLETTSKPTPETTSKPTPETTSKPTTRTRRTAPAADTTRRATRPAQPAAEARPRDGSDKRVRAAGARPDPSQDPFLTGTASAVRPETKAPASRSGAARPGTEPTAGHEPRVNATTAAKPRVDATTAAESKAKAKAKGSSLFTRQVADPSSSRYTFDRSRIRIDSAPAPEGEANFRKAEPRTHRGDMPAGSTPGGGPTDDAAVHFDPARTVVERVPVGARR